jgi:hypothetical protein
MTSQESHRVYRLTTISAPLLPKPHLAIAGRGVPAVLLASALVAFLLLVTADLDRPTRGMIRVPDTVLTNQLASMTQPPTATAPRSPSR